jgi:hypothetical protein
MDTPYQRQQQSTATTYALLQQEWLGITITHPQNINIHFSYSGLDYLCFLSIIISMLVFAELVRFSLEIILIFNAYNPIHRKNIRSSNPSNPFSISYFRYSFGKVQSVL